MCLLLVWWVYVFAWFNSVVVDCLWGVVVVVARLFVFWHGTWLLGCCSCGGCLVLAIVVLWLRFACRVGGCRLIVLFIVGVDIC